MSAFDPFQTFGLDLITFAQAKERARKLRSAVELGGDPAGVKDVKKAVPTYAEIAAQHLAHAKTYQKRPENTEALLNNHLIGRWGKSRLDEITQQEVAKWLAEKRTAGLAPATVEKIRVTFSRTFELAMRWNIPGAHNPVRGIPRPKFSNARARYLSAAELHGYDRQSSSPAIPC